MSRIKVLHVLDKIDINSGVSSVVLNYYTHIDKNKIQFDFVVHREVENVLEKDLRKKGAHIYQMPSYSIKNFLTYEKEFLEIIQKSHCQIVHCHVPHEAFFCLKVAKKAGIASRIIHSHNSYGADSFKKNIRNFLLSRLGKYYANMIFACSDKALFYLVGKGKRKSQRIFRINNAVDSKRFLADKKLRQEMRRTLQLEGKFVLGHVGRFAPQKNHKFLVDVLEGLSKRRMNTVLLLIGTGELKEEIVEYVKQKQMEDRVYFIENIFSIEDYFQCMDIFLLPSFYEGLPVVAVEAQAAGLPCLLSNTISKMISLTKETKQLSIKEIEPWVLACLEYQIEEVHEDTRRQIKRAGYDIETESKRLEKIYQDILRKNEKSTDFNVHL